jgi:hypothetical protein
VINDRYEPHLKQRKHLLYEVAAVHCVTGKPRKIPAREPYGSLRRLLRSLSTLLTADKGRSRNLRETSIPHWGIDAPCQSSGDGP